MTSIIDKHSETWPEAHAGAGFLSLARLRRHCAHKECPERGRLWPRWRARTEEIEFAGQRYCCPSCAQGAFAEEIRRHLLLARQENERPYRVPLGLLLVSRGVISSAQLQEALLRQRERPGLRLGSLLLEMRVLGETALTAALGIQWGCPVFPLETSRVYHGCGRLVPFALLQSRGILPAHHSPSTRVLHLAFTQRIDYTLLYAIEQMSGYRAMPCVAPDRLVAEALHRLYVPPSEESVFDSVRGPQEMAHLAAGYAGRLHAARVQIAGAAHHVWFRFENPRGSHHLLFYSPPQLQPAIVPFR
jgi:hypothetical protein